MTLNDLNLNQEGYVKKINGDASFVSRIKNIGFSEETQVSCVLVSPFQSIKAYLINNVIIAIRDCDAKNIEVDLK